jgi:hypothetical protein
MCGSDEPYLYPARSVTYQTEDVGAYQVQSEVAYNGHFFFNRGWLR